MHILLDANILFHNSLRSLFIYLHQKGFLKVYLSTRIINEWKINYTSYLLKKDGHNSFEILDNFVFNHPEVIVIDFEEIGREIKLFDSNDHHVLQAAIKSESIYIVTYNTKDFPKSKLRPLGIKAVTPQAYFLELSKDDHLVRLTHDYAKEFLKEESDLKAFIDLKINMFEKFNRL